jgi:hypothetical protein
MQINTSIRSVNKPEPVLQDSRGRLIEAGLKVAYNFQGNVILGTIKELKRSKWEISRSGGGMNNWWYLKFELLIENEDGHISKIKNPNSFIII